MPLLQRRGEERLADVIGNAVHIKSGKGLGCVKTSAHATLIHAASQFRNEDSSWPRP